MAENPNRIKPSSAAASGLRRDSAVIGLVCTAHFFSHFYIFAIPPMLPLIKADLGVSYTEMGLLLTLFSLSSGAAQYFMGVLVDRIGARWVLTGGMTLLAGAIAMMGVVPVYGALAAVCIGCRVGQQRVPPGRLHDPGIAGAVRAGSAGPSAFHTFSGMAGFTRRRPVVNDRSWRRPGTGGRPSLSSGAAGLLIVGLLLSQMRLLDERREQRTGPGQETATGLGLRAVVSPPVMYMFLFFFVVALVSLGMAGFMPAALQTHFRHGTRRSQPDPHRVPGRDGGGRAVRRVRSGPDAAAGSWSPRVGFMPAPQRRWCLSR